MYWYNSTDSQDICPSQWCRVSVSHKGHYKLRIKPSYNISASVYQQEQYQLWTFKQVQVKILTVQKNYD